LKSAAKSSQASRKVAIGNVDINLQLLDLCAKSRNVME